MKKTYNVIIYNGSNVLVCKQEYQAEDENEAIKKALDDITIYDGDTITIEEVE